MRIQPICFFSEIVLSRSRPSQVLLRQSFELEITLSEWIKVAYTVTFMPSVEEPRWVIHSQGHCQALKCRALVAILLKSVSGLARECMFSLRGEKGLEFALSL